jgi:VWFA-related protein
MRTLSLAVLAVATAVPQEAPTFRSTTRLVQVNVVVQAKKGGPVADLKREDFTLLEEGKPQKIAFFAVQKSGKLNTAPLKLPENVFSNRFGDRADVPQSVTAILIDSLNTPWHSQAYARNQVLRFLKQIQPHERVALYTMGRSLRVLHDYTSDASSLIDRLSRWSARVEPDLEASVGMAKSGDPMAEYLSAEFLEAEQRFADFIAGTRVTNTLQALESIAEHLAAVPGRKSLIWVSGGFPLMIGFDKNRFAEARDKRTFFEEMQRTMRAFNQSNVAIYPVDARGLMTNPSLEASRRYAPPMTDISWTPEHHETMRELAARTGGKAYVNRNDIDGAVREVFADAEVTYTLAYYPAETVAKDTFRDVVVKVSRPGVSVRHRKGYYALPDLDSGDVNAIQAEMRNAVWSPLDATAVAMNARVDLLKTENKYSVYTQVDAETISVQQVGDRWQGRVDFAFVLKSEDRRNVGSETHTIALNMTKPTYLRVLKEGLIYHHSLAVQPNATTMRIVVRDARSGLAGSITVPLGKVVAK